ncbi:MAG TPA: DUF4465 domain-containing protein [Bacteroidia bacterium]|nr:DUF4465 domain-containing protein [Bacteroidia bacterium]
MKKQLLSIALFTGILTASAQVTTTTQISDFESVVLTSNHHTVYNDSTAGGGFKSGNAYFPSKWDTSFGGYWSNGWAASSVLDSTNAYPNLYGCAAYKGYNNSTKYAVGTTYGTLTMRMTDSLIGKTVTGMYICNSTYAYKSMKKGDSFEPAFTAHNKDWFKLTVKKYYGGVLTNDSAEVYLADFRYSDTTQNYILNNWMWVNFASLGNVDSLAFFLSSSQTGSFGMNTPAYFCIDNVTLSTYRDTTQTAGIKNYFSENSLTVYPNPAIGETEIAYNTTTSVPVNMKLIDLLGNELIIQRAQSFMGLNKFKIDISILPAGVYYVTLNAGNNLLTQKVIKQ